MTLVEERDRGDWIELRLNREDKRNALSQALIAELIDGLWRAAARGPGAVISADGPVFSAGADLSEGVSFASDRPTNRLITALVEVPLFVVAVVEGGVYGAGVSLLSACPVVLATPSAQVGLPEARRGFFPAGVAPYLEESMHRRRIVSLGVAGGTLNSAEAAAAGVVTEVVAPSDLQGRTDGWMEMVAARPDVALQAKRYWVSRFTPAFRAGVEDMESIIRKPAISMGATGSSMEEQ